MYEYVKVLLARHKKLYQDARDVMNFSKQKAFRSHGDLKPCEQIVEEILSLQERARFLLAVKKQLDYAVSILPQRLKEAIEYRFYHKKMPDDICLRTVYRDSVRAIKMVGRRLEKRGMDFEWFLESFGEDEYMMSLFHYYWSQMREEKAAQES